MVSCLRGLGRGIRVGDFFCRVVNIIEIAV